MALYVVIFFGYLLLNLSFSSWQSVRKVSGRTLAVIEHLLKKHILVPKLFLGFSLFAVFLLLLT